MTNICTTTHIHCLYARIAQFILSLTIKLDKMNLRMIYRLALPNCRNRINIEAYWGIVPSLRALQKKPAVMQTEFATYNVCIIHKRFFHNSIILQLQKNKLKENETDVEDISTLQIKKRPTRRNKTIICEDKMLKPDVSVFISIFFQF